MEGETGSSAIETLRSVRSAVTFMAVQQPDRRDIAQPCSPYSIISGMVDGARIGIMASTSAYSLWCEVVEDLQV